MKVSEMKQEFVDKAGINHVIDELKAYADNASGGSVDLSDYYTKKDVDEKFYTKSEVDTMLPTVTVTKEGDTATITCTDANGVTTATISDGRNGTDGKDGVNGKDGKDGMTEEQIKAYIDEKLGVIENGYY